MKYGSVEYREKRNREERGWINERIQIIEQIPDNAFQSICYFSVLERFAQEYSNYPKHDATKAFCEFIMAFQENYDFF